MKCETCGLDMPPHADHPDLPAFGVVYSWWNLLRRNNYETGFVEHAREGAAPVTIYFCTQEHQTQWLAEHPDHQKVTQVEPVGLMPDNWTEQLPDEY